MKTGIFSFVLILLTASALVNAQNDAKIGFGLIAGPNFQTITGKDYNGDDLDHGLIIGFHAGVNANIPVTADFYFQPGLLFTTKGGKIFYELQADIKSADPGEATVKTKLNYIEMPLNLLYRPVLGDGHMLLGFGPYVALGIGGKETVSVDYSDIDEEFDVKFKNPVTANGTETSYYKPFDAGANIFFGYELSAGLFFQLNAQLGLLKINSEYEGMTGDKSNQKNTGFGLSLGYRF